MKVSKRTLSFLISIAVGVHFILFWTLSATSKRVDEAVEDADSQAGVFFASNALFKEDAVVNDISLLLDTAPLFLPTQYNYTTRATRLVTEVENDPEFEPFAPVVSLSSELRPPAFTKEDDMQKIRRLSEPDWPRGIVGVVSASDARATVKLEARDEQGRSLGYRIVESEDATDQTFARSWRPAIYLGIYDQLGRKGYFRRVQASGVTEVDERLSQIVDESTRDWALDHVGWVRIIVSPWLQ